MRLTNENASVSINIHEQNMDVERLIEAVRQRQILCEATRTSYKDSVKKEAAWRKVAAEVGIIFVCRWKLKLPPEGAAGFRDVAR